ncbi:hypothetical protein FZEAL_8280 [Fusarium zealandicum]|uniref:Zn(2)-C6 fungal-type domain-containing protein n=1 Tax=Fusarium zealandicum TaxID=1053134 RepID=A0A8H4XH15_9HYPO|nr:hypothetical protein FZEAL_8280 [Fusarium zealandicum]
MVYCGKPSKGCSKCRVRKIRCDEKDPACGQCEKRGLVCPGYRNLVDLMFRDESSHVISKAARTRPRPNARKRVQSVGRSPSPSPSPQSVIGPVSKSSPTFIIESGSAATSAPAPKSKSTTRPARKSAVRYRAPVLSALATSYSRSPSESSHDSLDDGNDINGLASDHVLLGGALSLEHQEQGTAFFFSRYVTADSGCHLNYAFIWDVWKPSAQARVDPVTVSMTAVGLAGLSQVTHCPETMTRAQQSYGIALKITHRALRDPVEVVKDTTMLAVLILGTYEFVSGHSPQTMRAWQDHVNGAAALASLRGSAQLRSKAGVSMFLMLCQSVLISCIQSGLPMPQALIDLRREIHPSDELDGPAAPLANPTYKALQARYDIKTGKLNRLDEIVDTLSSIDDEFSSILSELPASWNYHRVQLTEPDPRVLGQRCHVYSGLLESTTWNSVRAIRMLVSETIVEQLGLHSGATGLTALSECHLQLLARTTRLLEMLRQAIAASVPQHFGVVSIRDVRSAGSRADTVSVPAKKQACRVLSPLPAPDSQSPRRSEVPSNSGSPTLLDSIHSTTRQDDAERFMALASASHTIVWPLYTLGMSSSCSDEMRQYAIETLHAIHQETGLEQAHVVAGLLQEKAESAAPSTSILDKLPAVEESTLPPMV